LHNLLERFAGQHFAVVGAYCDDNVSRAKPIAEEMEMNWPSFVDGREGPVSKAWNVRSWPRYFILDRNGVIRIRDYWRSNFGDEIEKLLAE
jgi:hypothetical protein